MQTMQELPGLDTDCPPHHPVATEIHWKHRVTKSKYPAKVEVVMLKKKNQVGNA